MRDRTRVNANFVYFKVPALLKIWLTKNLRQVECCVWLVKTHSTCFTGMRKSGVAALRGSFDTVLSMDGLLSHNWDLLRDVWEPLVTVHGAGCTCHYEIHYVWL